MGKLMRALLLKRYLVLFLLLLAGLLLAYGLFFGKAAFFKEDVKGDRVYPELEYLEGKSANFDEMSDFFRNLAYEKGASYAFEVLKQAQLPSGIDIHLLGHVVGDVLYKQEGLDGIKVCTHDFRNACSHSIVIGLFLDKGDEALPEISEACRRAPGGSGAYTMCFHGLGHGILAFAEYNMEKAIGLCEKTGTEVYNYQEFSQCVGGTVMEMIAGVHDVETWKKKSKIYFKEDDPLYPCTADFMPKEGKGMCFTYITPHLFEAAGGNLANPAPESFEKAFRFCNKLAKGSPERSACYGGFGKEFIVLVQGRDIRRIEDLDNNQLATVYDWCKLADSDEGTVSCLLSAANSMYWGGENAYETPVQFCQLIEHDNHQRVCFENMMGAVNFYVQDRSYRSEFCNSLPETYQSLCRQRLGV